MHKMIKMVIVIVLGCTALNSVMAQEDERTKREQAQREVEKRTKKAERMVRDNEGDWSLERSHKGENTVLSFWKNKDESARTHYVFADSIEEAKKLYLHYLGGRTVGPIKSEVIHNLGDRAVLLIYPGNASVIVIRGRYVISVVASSEAVAKRFAKYYVQSIADEK